MNRKILIAVFFIGIILSSFLILNKHNFNPPHPSTSEAPHDKPMAPDFTLSNMHGAPVSLTDYRGKVVILNFWATWCPPCRAEMPSMEQLYRKMKGDDFVLLAVNVDKNGQSAVASFAKKISLSFPVLLDKNQNVADLYRVMGIPQTFIINKNGEIVKEVSGAHDWNSPKIIKLLTSLSKGKAI